jgi:hypothetical protein
MMEDGFSRVSGILRLIPASPDLGALGGLAVKPPVPEFLLS